MSHSLMTVIYSDLFVKGTSSVGLEPLCRADSGVGVKSDTEDDHAVTSV